MSMSTERWDFMGRYSKEVFGRQDEHLAGLMDRAVAAGLPDIAVSSDVGRLLMILTSLTRGQLAIELGTLAGYSGIWIGRGLAPGGKLITVEYQEKHADFARREFEAAGLADRVEIRIGAGIDVLQSLRDELEPGTVDVLFVDAVKTEYARYFELARPLIAPGGLVLADNVYGAGALWIDEGHGTDEFNRLVAGDPDFEAVAVPLRQGLLIGRRIR